MSAVDPPPALTADQLRIAMLFAAMDDRRQQEAITRMTRIATTHPRRPRPVLRLVVGDSN